MMSPSVKKIAEAVRDMLKGTGKSLTANQILDIIDKKRYYCIFAAHLGQALRELENGIEWAHIPQEKQNKQGDVYLYTYKEGRTAYRDIDGTLWGDE